MQELNYLNKLEIKLLICKDEITKTRAKIETTDCQGALSAIMDNS